MEETEVLDFDKICRLCLVEKGSMLRIFAKKTRNNRTPLPIRIMSCTSLEIYQGDGLPSKICPKCLWDVNQAYTFRERCDGANEKLLQYVHRMKHPDNKQDSAADDQMEVEGRTPLEFLDEKINIMEKIEPANLPDETVKIEIHSNVNQNGDDDEDDRPISELLLAGVSSSLHLNLSHPTDAQLQSDGPGRDDSSGQDHDPEDDVETIGAGDSCPETDDEDDSDLDADPVCALVETEMVDDDRASELDREPLPAVSILNTPQPISVRKFLENEFGPDSTYSQHKRYSEYSKIKKKQKSAEEKVAVKAGRYGRDGWQPFNLVDLKPRKKYAPREKNLISNNSSPIIEQDGSKSKFRACMHCGKVVLGKNMGIHVKIHVGNKSHLCDICGKSFLYKKTLETHKRVHSGERPCVCKICDKTFRSSSRLSDHMSTHTGRKPFICEICAVAFRIKGHLKKHLRVHSGEKPYICSFCEKAFSDAWNMKCHMRIHTGEKPPHACPVCGQCFLRRNKMEEHCKLTHGEEFVLPRKQALVQRLKNDLVELNDDLRVIAEREREEMIRQEAERQLLAQHFENQRQELADSLGMPMPLPLPLPIPMPMPVPAFPGNLPAGIFSLQ